MTPLVSLVSPCASMRVWLVESTFFYRAPYRALWRGMLTMHDGCYLAWPLRVGAMHDGCYLVWPLHVGAIRAEEG